MAAFRNRHVRDRRLALTLCACTAERAGVAPSRLTLLLLVVMTGAAPISLYMLVPALPVLATTFGRDISIAQMTVSLYMVGIACSQLIMGPLSDRFGRRPVLL